ncbi:MAG: NusA-like transcription termination signal-binding factor [Candidatus Altiarchaeota archaeon]|nr:NusA-like transcription termination signal-binding factor [Candidatus Altiarchaeota archaeon]
MKLKIDNETFRYLSVFGTLTGVGAVDCFSNGGEVVFVVEAGKIGIAVGKKGSNIKKVETLLKKKIRLIEHSQDAVSFIHNIIFPLRPKNVYISTKSDGAQVINIQVDVRMKKTLMREGKNLYNLLNQLVSRHFPNFKVEVRDA